MREGYSMAKRMNLGAAARVSALCLASLLLYACATSGAQSRTAQSDEEAVHARTEGSDATVNRFNLKSWSAPNDHTVILTTRDGSRYRAETLGPCFGLDFANGVAFANRGAFNSIDRFSSVVLSDGRRCPFQSFEKLVAPESKALDAYEKAGEKAQSDPAAKEDSRPK
jgi:hypothetical protein